MIKLGKVKDKYFVNCTLIYKYISVISMVVMFKYYKIHKRQGLFCSYLVTTNKFIFMYLLRDLEPLENFLCESVAFEFSLVLFFSSGYLNSPDNVLGQVAKILLNSLEISIVWIQCLAKFNLKIKNISKLESYFLQISHQKMMADLRSALHCFLFFSVFFLCFQFIFLPNEILNTPNIIFVSPTLVSKIFGVWLVTIKLLQ